MGILLLFSHIICFCCRVNPIKEKNILILVKMIRKPLFRTIAKGVKTFKVGERDRAQL